MLTVMGNHSKQELFVEDGSYRSRQARPRHPLERRTRNHDESVSERGYIENRIITDEAKAIFERWTPNADGKLTREEFGASGKDQGEDLTKAVFEAFGFG